MTLSEQVPPPTYPPPPGYAPQSPAPQNSARIVWIVVGAVFLFLGVGAVGLPVFAGVMGAPVDLGLAFGLAAAADVLFAGVYVAGLRVARRAPSGQLRAIPPAIAAAVIFVGFYAAMQFIFSVASYAR